MSRSVWEDVGRALLLVAIITLVLAPFAWSAIELVPALWRLFAIASPEYAEIVWRGGANVVALAWGLWLAIEFYRYVLIFAVFVVAALGSYFGGPYRGYFCAPFFVLGLALLGYVLQRLSIVEWSLFALAASDLSAAFPVLPALVNAWLQPVEESLGPLEVAAAEFIGLSAIVVCGLASRSLVKGRLAEFQGQLQSAFIGEVDRVFPRASLKTAQACAEARRNAIRAYLNAQQLPPKTYRQVSFSNGSSPFRFVREYVERRQEVSEVNPLRVAAFLEVPKGSPIVARPVTLDTAEEVAGQFVRLLFESERGPPPSWPMPWDAPNDILLLLLGRVVDAAILADQHFDSQREDESWNAMPFFERIYLDYRPIPPPLECFLGPILGDALPARVVIETHYAEVFRRALHGGKGKYGQFKNWFGIGIQIEPPNLPQDYFSRLKRVLGGTSMPLKIERRPWFNAPAPCRRLKSRVAGGVSGELTLELSVPSPIPEQPPSASKAVLHVMSSGPLADGCPSVISSLPAEPPEVARGGVSNAPAMWLLPPRTDFHTTCQTICVQAVPADTAVISVDLAQVGVITRAPSEIFNFYSGLPTVGWVRARAWVGAFFDRDLCLANRFPLLACSRVLGDGGVSMRTDLRGAFVSLFWSKMFGGVFVATQGPEHASNLLLPEPLLNGYLTHLLLAGSLAELLPQVEESPFVPAPEGKRAR